MPKDFELEQIKLRKIQSMLDQADHKSQVNDHPITIKDDNFQNIVKENQLLVVDFWAPWCGPCRMVGPLIEQLSSEYAGKVAFGKLNVDENTVIASSFGVQSIPTLIVFKNGEPVETIVGACPKSHIESKFKPYLNSS
jgi:thioredoxin 1